MSSPAPTTGLIRPRLAAVDDDTLIRLALPPLLDPDFELVGTYQHAEELLAARPTVDLVLLDLHLAGTSDHDGPQGPDAIRAVTAAGYRALIYTNETRRLLLARCLAAGAAGIIHKAEPAAGLVDAIGRILDGQLVITTALAGLAEACTEHDQLPDLTARQIDVLRGRARGEPFKLIATRLGITRKTAEEHMGVVSRKFATYLREHSPADLERHLGHDTRA